MAENTPSENVLIPDRAARRAFVRQYRAMLAAVEKTGRLRSGKIGVVYDSHSGAEILIRFPERALGLGRRALRFICGFGPAMVMANVEIHTPLEDEPVDLGLSGVYNHEIRASTRQNRRPADVQDALALFHGVNVKEAQTRKETVMERASTSQIVGQDAKYLTTTLKALIHGDQKIPARITYHNALQRGMAEIQGQPVPPPVSIRFDNGGAKKHYGIITLYDPVLDIPHRYVHFALPRKGKKPAEFFIRDRDRGYYVASPAERRVLVAALQEALTPEALSPDMSQEAALLPPPDVRDACAELLQGGSRLDRESGVRYNHRVIAGADYFEWRDALTKFPCRIVVKSDHEYYTLTLELIQGGAIISIPIDPEQAQDPERYVMLFSGLHEQGNIEDLQAELLMTAYDQIRRIRNGTRLE